MRYLLFLMLTASAWAATGDITAVTVDADGWWVSITIEGVAPGGTYDFDYGANNVPGTDTPYLTVTSEGYSVVEGVVTLGTTTRTVYLTRALRKAYPNEASLDETDDAGNVTIKVALSEFVYDDDESGAGKSGTDVTATIPAGWYTNVTASSPYPSGAVTNNSTLDYPKVLGRWDNLNGTMTADRVTEAFTLSAMAFHKFGIACVDFDADGATSTHNQGELVSTQTAVSGALNGYYWNVYRTAPIALTGYTDDELINLRFRAYPKVGDADTILDTDSFTDIAAEAKGFNKAVVVCDKDADSTIYAYVDGTGPDDGTVSGTLATAFGDPYATIGAAVADGANVIYLSEATHDPAGGAHARVASTEWVRVLPYPGNTKASTIIQVDASPKTYDCARLSFEGLTVTLADTSSWLDGEDADNTLRFRSCTFNSGAVGKPTAGLGYRSDAIYYQSCDGDLSNEDWVLTIFSTTKNGNSFEDCAITEDVAASATVTGVYSLVGCKITGNFIIVEPAVVAGRPNHDGVCYVSNIWSSFNHSTQGVCRFGYVEDLTTGIALVGNVIEVITTTQLGVGLAADGTTFVANNFLVWHNVIYGDDGSGGAYGGRCNFGYNDIGAAAYARLNWSQIGNLIHNWNNKDDTFNHGTDGPNAARIGGWPVGYNVGSYGNIRESTASPEWRGEWDGLYTIFGSAASFVDDNSGRADDSGGGDYRPVVTSNALSLLPIAYRTINYDLDGNARTDDAGAYEFLVVSDTFNSFFFMMQ